MSSEPPSSQPSFSVPPMQPMYVPVPTVTKWPVVIGVIAIVFGVLGAIGGLWGVIGAAFTQGLASMGDPQQAAMVKEIMGRILPYTILVSALSLIAALVLLVAGIGLTKRCPWGASLSRGWAVFKMLVVVASTLIGFWMQTQFMSQMSQPAGIPAMGGVEKVMQLFTFLIGLAWGWALPVFMLIWFSRERIKAEVAGWSVSTNPDLPRA